MNHVERIAFAMFKSDYPPHIAETLTLEAMPEDLAAVWARRRASYRRRASAAVVEIRTIWTEREAS